MIQIPKFDFANFSKQEQQKLITAGVAVVVTIAAVYFFLLAPGWKKFAALKKNISEMQVKITEGKELLGQKETVERSAKEGAARLKSLPQWIPEEGDSSWILRLVGDVSNNQKVRTAGIKPLDIKEAEKESKDLGGGSLAGGENFRWAMSEIEIKTDYHSFGRFIDELERKNPCLKISKVSIVANREDLTHHGMIFRVLYPIAKKQNVEAGGAPSK